MTEESTTEFAAREGDNTLNLDAEKDNSAASSAGEETTTEETQSSEGDNSQNDDSKKPFHEQPAWKEREQTWDKRFNEQETRHQDDLRKLREEFGQTKVAPTAEETKIPAWFGGNQEQWNAYRADQERDISAAEERALKRITDAQGQQDKAVQEATAFMQSELAAIQGDKTLNPTGAPIDPQKLLKYVMDEDLIDSKGRWNYRAAFKMMTAVAPKKVAPAVSNERRAIAAATGSEQRAETKALAYTTSEDFEKEKPW